MAKEAADDLNFVNSSSKLFVHPEVDLTSSHLSVLLGIAGVPTYEDFCAESYSTRAEKRFAVYRYLKNFTDHAQKRIRLALEKHHGDNFTAFWIANVISVHNISGQALQKIIAEAGDVLGGIYPWKLLRRGVIPKDVAISNPSHDAEIRDVEWNIAKIGADKAWAKGINGTGVVVATLDGGVRYTHDALVGSYRGTMKGGSSFSHDYNWKDWPYKNAVPFDSDGHGTNVAGILSGSKESGVGVAPGAKWISGKIFNYAGYSSNEWTLAGVQWAMCPTPVNSDDDANCTLGADIVSCSWGEDDATTGFLKQAIAAWLKADMVPVFAVGNAGPQCATSVSPADYAGVISVGATDKGDNMVAFSSRGPGANGTSGALPYDPLTPNILAPGLEIQGPSCKSDDGYTGYSGTSQAAPHLAGAAALLMSANPSLTRHQIALALYGSADTATLTAPDSGWLHCGAPGSRASFTLGKEAKSSTGNEWPNFIGGYGRLDAEAALARLEMI